MIEVDAALCEDSQDRKGALDILVFYRSVLKKWSKKCCMP